MIVGGTLAETSRTNLNTHRLQDLGRLVAPGSPRWYTVEHNDNLLIAGRSYQLDGRGDGFQVQDRRPAGNDNQVGHLCS